MTAGTNPSDDDPPPLVWEHFSTVRNELMRSERLLLCLDFDGTLAPIVDDPWEATVPADTKRVLQRIANRSSVDVAIVSGRSLSNLRTRVDVPPVILVGNHGLEIERDDASWIHPVVEAAREDLEAVRDALETRFVDVSGVFLEDKYATVTIHYRRIRPNVEEDVQEIVEGVISGLDSVVVTRGHRVFEVRPAIDWHKGDAVRVLLDDSDVDRTIYVGDDETDEDAHRELAETDHIGVTVGDEPSVADLRVRDPDGTRRLLERLSEVNVGARA